MDKKESDLLFAVTSQEYISTVLEESWVKLFFVIDSFRMAARPLQKHQVMSGLLLKHSAIFKDRN